MKSLMLVAIVTGALSVSATVGPAQPASITAGDADCNATVDSVDALLIRQLDAALIGVLPCPGSADVNDSGAVNGVDAALILRLHAAIIPSFDVGYPQVGAGRAVITTGQLGTAPIFLGFPEHGLFGPGVGAWTLDVTYDPAVISAEECEPFHGGVCNPEFDSDTVRVTGAAVPGLFGDLELAQVRFRCLRAGSSSLTVSIDVLADGTVGGPRDFSDVTELRTGEVTCL
jgi:hypothetical protein